MNANKITWTVLVTIVGLAFSSGTGWISIFNNKDTNDKQWTRINALESASSTSKAQLTAYHSLILSQEKSNKELSTAITGLTVATQVASSQAKSDAVQRERDAKFISKLSEDINGIKMKIERIEEKLLH